MKREANHWKARLAAAGLVITLVCGCQQGWKAFYQRPSIEPLGAISDPVWQAQELGAEQADFTVYQHEFEKNAVRLNTDGEDHVKQLAARLLAGQDTLVVVERSRMTARPDTEYRYAIHVNPELDNQRRELLVLALSSMGVADAEERVIVAPAYTTGFEATEAAQAYEQGIGSGGAGGGGFGGFFFGGGGF